jgi:hypothetical protein
MNNQEYPKWKIVDSKKYFENIVIPDDWDTLENFVDWYMEQRMPLMVPWNAEVIKTDDAVAICIFRKGRYQVEFYLEFPRMSIPEHAHPRMEVITVDLGGGGLSPKNEIGTSKKWGTIDLNLKAGEVHGGGTMARLGAGMCFLAFQRWDDPQEMSSAAVQWQGITAGPIQENLIKRKKGNVLVRSGYADIEQPSENSE